MADGAVQLPAGYTLDTPAPSSPAASPSASVRLPAGYTLDASSSGGDLRGAHDLGVPIALARKENWPEDQTLDYIGRFYPDLVPRIQQAQKSGRSATDILDDLSGTAPEQPSVGGFVGNTLESAGKFVGNAAHAVTHPLDTASNVVKLAAGTLENATDPLISKMTGQPAPSSPGRDLASTVKQNLLDRYGSLESFGHTFYHDPVGVLADLSMLAGGAGAGLKALGVAADAAQAGSVANAARIAAEAAGRVSSGLDPLNAVTSTTRAGLRAANLPGPAEALYQSALKPSKTNDLDDIDEMVKTGIENRIPISRGGYEKLYGLLQDLNTQIASKIQAGAQNGAAIDPAAVAQRVDQVRPRFSQQVNPVDDVNALDKAQQEFVAQHSTPGRPGTTLYGPNGQPIQVGATPATVNPIPLDEAQAIKQNTYRQLKGKYNELGSASIEAQKALARGIKEEIATQFPEIAHLNAKESKLLGLDDALEMAVKRAGNHNLLSLGATAAHSPVVGVMHAVLTPAVKSRLAIALDYAYSHTPSLGKSPGLTELTSRVDQYANQIEAGKATIEQALAH